MDNSQIVDNNMEVLNRTRLLQSELTRYLALLTQHYQPEQVWLFGSFASVASSNDPHVMSDMMSRGADNMDEPNTWSDLDLVIVKDTDLRFLERLKEVIMLLKPKVGVDILVYTPDEFNRMSRESSFVQSEVLHKGRLLYERTK